MIRKSSMYGETEMLEHDQTLRAMRLVKYLFGNPSQEQRLKLIKGIRSSAIEIGRHQRHVKSAIAHRNHLVSELHK